MANHFCRANPCMTCNPPVFFLPTTIRYVTTEILQDNPLVGTFIECQDAYLVEQEEDVD